MKLALIALGASCQAKVVEPDADGTYRIAYHHTSDAFTWTVLGDWGGWPAPQFTSPIQLSVAESMKRMGRLSPSQYIIGIGDNFYFHGVENDEDEMFEKVYFLLKILRII